MGNKFKWFLGILMVLSFIAVSMQLSNKKSFSLSLSSLTKSPFEETIRKDLFNLKNKNIPRQFLSLHQVFWQNHGKSPQSKNISPIVADAFRISKNGSYYLQADYFDVDDSHGIIQFSFFEKKSHNKVYEISREYSF
jgi:hypothetical protein